MTEQPIYSLVFPLKDEEGIIPILYERVVHLLGELDGPAEVIFVDDGSEDRSLELLKSLQIRDPRLTIVELSRNFGHQIAITAGLDIARGKAVIVMDSDMQDPLDSVHPMIREWKAGSEIVYGVRQARKGESLLRRFVPWLFYRALNALTSVSVPLDVGDFRLIDRKALDAFLEMRERNRFVRGMFAWIGFKTKAVYYTREGRPSGRSKYSWRKLMNLGLNGIFSFSFAPVKISILTGGLFSVFSLALAILYPLLAFARSYSWNSRTQMLLLILFLAGMNLMMLGLIGIYVIRSYDETRARPLYIIRNIYRESEAVKTS